MRLLRRLRPRSGDESVQSTRLYRSFAEFDRVYQESVGRVLRHWTPQMQREVALHNVGWREGSTDFELYLRASTRRYYQAYLTLCSLGPAVTVCDIGGFWGAFPLALRQLGFTVTMTEALQYYSRSFDALFDSIRTAGVEVVDYDPFLPGSRLERSFSFISVMAVLEHYPHSPRTFLTNVTSILIPGGILYVEVPNIAFLPKRLGLLRGRSPLAPIREIYESEVPFIGHHHEYTLAELLSLSELSELRVQAVHCYNYTPGVTASLRSVLRHPLQQLIFATLPTFRELLAVAFRKVQ